VLAVVVVIVIVIVIVVPIVVRPAVMPARALLRPERALLRLERVELLLDAGERRASCRIVAGPAILPLDRMPLFVELAVLRPDLLLSADIFAGVAG